MGCSQSMAERSRDATADVYLKEGVFSEEPLNLEYSPLALLNFYFLRSTIRMLPPNLPFLASLLKFSFILEESNKARE